MVVKTQTKDNEGRTYDKVFYGRETTVISCISKKNRKLGVISNFSLRHGDSTFGEEVVLQFIISQTKEEYEAKSPVKEHIEAYFPVNKQTLEMFEHMTDLIRKKLEEKDAQANC